MAEKVIQNNQSIVPFLGERLSFIQGLDPLGLQNTSDATFSQLLPGLNNVTGRIRYYSFYCWLLDLYSKENGSTNPEEQKQFIRRAEYIIALASLYFTEDSSSIPGSNYARKEINEYGKTTHDLQQGIFKKDGSTRETYWNYSTGAFGQYYLGSLRDICIVNNREKQGGLYVRTSNNSDHDVFVSGEQLAIAFENNISIDSKKMFVSCLEKGIVTEHQLKKLLPDFNLTIIPDKSEEQKLLVKLLLQKDYPLRIEELPSTLRNQTIKYLLSFIEKKSDELSDRAFVYDCYNSKGKAGHDADDCLMGWYYYQFNEFWHFANTSILNGTLAYLENTVGPNWMSLSQLVQNVTDEVIKFFIEGEIIETKQDSVRVLVNNLLEYTEYDCLENTINSFSTEKVAEGFSLLMALYLKNKAQLSELKQYAENRAIAKDGEGAGYFINQFEEKQSISVGNFIYDYIYLNIIYRHQYVAFRKIRGGIQSTQKFIIEDQQIRYLGNFDAAFTGPRVGRLISFLRDLGAISNVGQLTKYGKGILNGLRNDDN